MIFRASAIDLQECRGFYSGNINIASSGFASAFHCEYGERLYVESKAAGQGCRIHRQEREFVTCGNVPARQDILAASTELLPGEGPRLGLFFVGIGNQSQ
jgi:hypothetical protein